MRFRINLLIVKCLWFFAAVDIWQPWHSHRCKRSTLTRFHLFHIESPNVIGNENLIWKKFPRQISLQKVNCHSSFHSFHCFDFSERNLELFYNTFNVFYLINDFKLRRHSNDTCQFLALFWPSLPLWRSSVFNNWLLGLKCFEILYDLERKYLLKPEAVFLVRLETSCEINKCAKIIDNVRKIRF